MGDPSFPNPIIEIFIGSIRIFLFTASYSPRAIGIRHPVPKAREVTFSTGAACFL